MQLTFDADVEAFRAEFVAFLDEHLPADDEALERAGSSSYVPDWGRRWQRLMFDNGWLLPGYPPEFGGRNATILQRPCTRRTDTSQGVSDLQSAGRRHHLGIVDLVRQTRAAAPLGRPDPARRNDRILGMSEPGAGSDLASLRTRAVSTATSSW